MSALTILLVTIAFVLLPTPNITTKYIQVIGVIICSILGIINIDWQVILDSFDNLNKQYYLFLMGKINNENAARTILNSTYIIAIQPIIIGGYFLFTKQETSKFLTGVTK